ncbi:MAG: RidA family protein [Planctomycetota bacterium]
MARLRLCVPLLMLLWSVPGMSQGEEPVQYLEPTPATGSSAAVIVQASPWAQTSQMLAWDEAGKVVRPDDVAVQSEQVLKNLETALQVVESRLDQTVKLNVYVAHEESVSAVQQVVAKRFAGPAKPAVTYVTTALPHADALVAMDAIAVITSSKPVTGVRTTLSIPATSFRARVTTMPLGSRIYISGQADQATTLAEATRLTLLGLEKSLKFSGRAKPDVVQLKCFLLPMSRVADVERELENFFAPAAVPAVSYVEWESTLPIEIEVVAHGGATPQPAPVASIEYLTPPELKASPVFSRMARVHHPSTIFIGGLHGATGANGTQQVEQIFDQLGKLLQASGSDFKHLAKATYYVSQDQRRRSKAWGMRDAV